MFKICIIAAACLMYSVSAGLRSVYGIMLSGISMETGIAYATVSSAIAVGQLVFGIAQPIFGIIALKKSNRFVLVVGSICMSIGLAAIPFCRVGWLLTLFLGILLPVGTGAVSFGMIMGAITPKLGEERAAAASGLVNASSGIGSVFFSPILQSAFSAVGVTKTIFSIAILVLLLVPVSMIISGSDENEKGHDNGTMQDRTPVMYMFMSAFGNKNYIFLLIGFFTCGFHMAIIETHLYSQIISYGIAEATAAIIFSIYGIATIASSLISGFLCSKYSMKWVLGAIYGSRFVWIAAFFILPKKIPVIIIFTILLGLTGAATVTPTSGLVSKLFGAENLATLFGIVFVAHQLGSFLSTWLGGISLEITGNYTVIWLVSAVLSLIAMLVSYGIKADNSSM